TRSNVALVVNSHGNAYALYANGTAAGTSGWSSSSDARYKTHVAPLCGALGTILSLRGVSFDWRCDEFPQMKFDDNRQIGFIAQEVEQVLPEIVHTDTNGYKSVTYDRVVPVLLEAMKERQRPRAQQINRIGQVTG